MRKKNFFMRLIVLSLFMMMFSGCAYVTMSLTIGASSTIIVGSAMGIHHNMKQETQDSIKQAVADSLKVVYPTVSPDSLPAMVEKAIEEKKEAAKKARHERIAGALLGLAGAAAFVVVLLCMFPLGASPGLGD